MAREKQIMWDVLDEFTPSQLRKVLPKLAKRANTRLRALEKSGYKKNAYRYAQQASLRDEKPRFKEGVKTLTPQQIRREYRLLKQFLNARTSTISGQKKIEAEREKFFQEIADKLKLNLNFSEKSDEFFEFLNGKDYENIIKYLDSHQVVDTILEWEDNGADFEEMAEAFEEFLQGKKTFYEMKQSKLDELKARREGRDGE